MSTFTATHDFDEAARRTLARELKHFATAPASFLDAWKRGVTLAGAHLFGTGPRADVEKAASLWDLCPKMPVIERAIGVMSPGEKTFLAALVSFYNAEDGGRLLKRVGVHGFADLGGLDLPRRIVIAALLLNYTGW